MPLTDFELLPSDARLWVFGASRPLSSDEESTLLHDVDDFLNGWKAHGSPLTAARDWRYGRLLLVAVDERSMPPSGCSIDAMVQVLKGLEGRLGVTLVDNAPVWFSSHGEPRWATRSEFAALAKIGEVGPDTTVFDSSVTRVADVREGRWEVAASETWMKRAFFSAPSV